MPKIDRYQRQAAFAALQQFDCTATADDFIEVTPWYNGEGFDVSIRRARDTFPRSHGEERFQLTWGQFKALRKIVKELDG